MYRSRTNEDYQPSQSVGERSRQHLPANPSPTKKYSDPDYAEKREDYPDDMDR